MRSARAKARTLLYLALSAAACCVTPPASAQLALDEPPIDYFSGALDDPVARLQTKLEEGAAELRHDEKRGYLDSVLEYLGVPSSSQVLVFSKTSLQLKWISPRSPRALYFADDAYVGWVRGGDVLEFSAVDPRQGAIFYTLSQKKTPRPKFVRHTHKCLQCHSSSLARGVPGHIVRSVLPAPDGQPVLSAGTFLTDHKSPLTERWGGWYVTGKHGEQRHLGNLLVRGSDDLENLDTSRGANITDLSSKFETSSYLTPHSDIVALTVLEHQAQVHNLITRANFLTRIALRDQKVINEMTERPPDYCSESTERRIQAVGESLVEYLLFCDEATLTDPITGTSDFAAEFVARGLRDKRGRSLRDFDLKTRLFRYPLSYLVYSEPFDALPAKVRDYVYRRLWKVLTGREASSDFDHLSTADCRAILEILAETKSDLPDYFHPEEKRERRTRAL